MREPSHSRGRPGLVQPSECTVERAAPRGCGQPYPGGMRTALPLAAGALETPGPRDRRVDRARGRERPAGLRRAAARPPRRRRGVVRPRQARWPSASATTSWSPEAGAGAAAPRGVAHTYWNPRPEPARYLLAMGPTIAALIRALHEPGGGDDLAALFARTRASPRVAVTLSVDCGWVGVVTEPAAAGSASPYVGVTRAPRRVDPSPTQPPFRTHAPARTSAPAGEP